MVFRRGLEGGLALFAVSCIVSLRIWIMNYVWLGITLGTASYMLYMVRILCLASNACSSLVCFVGVLVAMDGHRETD
jgi:hypothetical protein